MSHLLNIKAFFFNAKKDYLPYYKHFTIQLEDDAIAKDILVAIKAQNENFAYPELNLIFKINDLIVEEDTPLISIIKKLGTTLQIDPANSYRSNNGLIINNDDFMKSYELLDPYATESDKKYYKTLYALHYASETEKFDREYIGDAILVLAHKMISEGNSHKDSILEAITSVHSGLLACEYENNLFNPQHHTAAISALKEMVKGNPENSSTFLSKIKARFIKPQETMKVEIENLEEKQIAYYQGHNENTAMQAFLKDTDIATVTFSRAHKLSGLSILKDNKILAYKKAGAILLEAFDAGAEVLVIEDDASYDMMQTHFAAIEKTIGRKMLGFELITAKDYLAQLATVTA